jgi:hypothetical protein
MALIQEIECVTKERQVVHKPTRCLASEFIGPGDKRYLQLDTYGSDDREFPEKVSQAIQLDEDAARKMIDLIEPLSWPSRTSVHRWRLRRNEVSRGS